MFCAILLYTDVNLVYLQGEFSGYSKSLTRVADPHHFYADPDNARCGSAITEIHRETLWLHFWPLKLLNFCFIANPDPTFLSNTDPDPDPAQPIKTMQSVPIRIRNRDCNTEISKMVILWIMSALPDLVWSIQKHFTFLFYKSKTSKT